MSRKQPNPDPPEGAVKPPPPPKPPAKRSTSSRNFSKKHDDAERLFCLSLINSLGVISMDQMSAILGRYIEYRDNHKDILSTISKAPE